MLRRWSVKLALVVALLALGAPARVLADRKEEAHKASDRGDRAYAKTDYAGALAEYKASYDRYAKPYLIFRLAECRRQLGQDADALALYKKYLAKVTRGPDRRKAEQYAAELEKKLAEAAEPTAAPEPVAQQTDAEAPPLIASEPGERAKKGEKPPAITTATAPKQDSLPPGWDPINEIHEPVPKYVEPKAPPVWKPVHKRWYVWTAVGVGVVAIGAGVALGLVYGLPKFTSELPVGGPGASALTVRF